MIIGDNDRVFTGSEASEGTHRGFTLLQRVGVWRSAAADICIRDGDGTVCAVVTGDIGRVDSIDD